MTIKTSPATALDRSTPPDPRPSPRALTAAELRAVAGGWWSYWRGGW